MAFLGQTGATNGLPNMLFRDSMNFAPTITFDAYVYVIGGGGSGGFVGNNNNYSATGGGAGGCAVSRLKLSSGQTYVITIGAGGNYTYGSTYGDGNDGVNTTFVNSSESVSITGNGGSGGNHASASGADGGAGGDASGHNLIKYVGGAAKNTDATKKVSGGGSVGLYMVGQSGEVLGHTNENTATADGGSMHGPQVGGTYGDTDMQYNYHNSNQGPPVVMSPFSDLYAVSSFNGRSYVSSSVWEAQEQYSPANAQLSHYGGGHRITSTMLFGGVAGPFAGGNGLFNASSTFDTAYAAHASLGGGGGSAFNAKSSGTSEAYSGRGGHGAVLIFPIAMG